MDPTEIINESYAIANDGFRHLLQRLKDRLKDKKNKNFVQDFDLSQNGKVIHAHIYYIEWLYGAVYRKKTEHYFLLYDFEVQKSELKQAHKDALSEFFSEIFLDELIKNSKLDTRDFEHYQRPFIPNIEKGKKEALLISQLWGPESFASNTRENVIRLQLLERFKSRNGSNSWWESNQIAITDPANLIELETDVVPDEAYPPFKISNLLYWRKSPELSENFSKFVGRASETGTNSINSPLSLQRAQNVIDFLNGQFTSLQDYIEGESLGLSAIGRGSEDPIILSEDMLEISENRSVQFSFFQEHDYIHLLTSDELKSTYKDEVRNVNTNLKNQVTYMENYLANPNQTFNLPAPTQGTLMDNLRKADLVFSFGMVSIDFAKRYKGDFRNLLNQTEIPNIPEGINLKNHKVNDPEGRGGTPPILPMAEMLLRGEFSTRNSDVFKNPLSPQTRLKNAASTFQLIINEMVQNYSSDYSPSLASDDYISYYKRYTKNDFTANSFLMVEMAKSEFQQALNHNMWIFRLDFTNDNSIYQARFGNPIVNLQITLADKLFMEGEELSFTPGFVDKMQDKIDSRVIRTFFWYAPEVKEYHYQMRKIVSKNIVKTVILSSHPELRLFYSGLGSFGMILFIDKKLPNLRHEWYLPSAGEANW
ncbi:OmpA family protein [Salinimicrobium sediminilitoris]|uniref:hypothetical protein n=1 Tax=Salinimicrobium sediminilitoris TaxID=2876715 RepID=UPI001E42C6FF|nr:hypothetical protein [Salinimicrobium sediminilitoris]MCC8358364.1 hypothetical protein [Salinimicrobium sediminilitoris]